MLGQGRYICAVQRRSHIGRRSPIVTLQISPSLDVTAAEPACSLAGAGTAVLTRERAPKSMPKMAAFGATRRLDRYRFGREHRRSEKVAIFLPDRNRGFPIMKQCSA